MNAKHIPQEIEPKWQRLWAESGLYVTRELPDRNKWYFLTMLPYPSGDLHIGHWYAMTPSDAGARYKRMNGYNVFFPIGFDAFGLPAENAAIKHGIHPYEWTMSNIEKMRGQLRSMGAMWSWEHEAVTCDPEFYKWSQWFFLKLYDHGLAYRKKSPVDFCPKCNTTLAREQVVGDERRCERCDTQVERRLLEQWYFKITNYAEELKRFDGIDWPERIRQAQLNWIGDRSEGAEVVFKSEQGDEIVIFTTRPDTLWGATFMVLAPEHPLVDKLTPASHREQVKAYQFQAGRTTEMERGAAEREKTGVDTGAFAINPVSGKRVPIWIADYVTMSYGTGAIMGVPAHDERDFAFALKFGLPIIPVIARNDGAAKSFVMPDSMKPGLPEALTAAGVEYFVAPQGNRGDGLFVTLKAEQIAPYVELIKQHVLPNNWCDVVGSAWLWIFNDATLDTVEVMELDSPESDAAILARCKAIEPAVRNDRSVMEMVHGLPFYRDVLHHHEYGTMIHSGEFSGTPGSEAKAKVTAWLEARGIGKFDAQYRLHDWLISRQRYWGAPIPMLYCDQCGVVPEKYENLPVILPTDAKIPPTGESPLKFHDSYLHATCPHCGGPARRETDTLDTFMCSSWYQYAYVSPYWKAGEKLSPDDLPWDKAKGDYWLPVDQYTGGPEHATMHLLYTRFFTKALNDMGIVPFREPMLRLFNQGIILGPDGNRMSKSRGNVVAPDSYVEKYGADTVRAYLMFIGPWDAGGPWNFTGIEGVKRFLERVWAVVTEPGKKAATGDGVDAQIRELRHMTHKTLQKVTEDVDAFKWNTAISALMEFNNYLIKARDTAVAGTWAWDEAIDTLLLMMAPEMPHIAEELWQSRHATHGDGNGAFTAEQSIHVHPWPKYDAELAKADMVTLVVQVNGKVRDRIDAPAGISEEQARELALGSPSVQKWFEGKQVRKVIFAGGKLINIVVG